MRIGLYFKNLYKNFVERPMMCILLLITMIISSWAFVFYSQQMVVTIYGEGIREYTYTVGEKFAADSSTLDRNELYEYIKSDKDTVRVTDSSTINKERIVTGNSHMEIPLVATWQYFLLKGYSLVSN